MRIAVVIPAYNRREITLKCLDQLKTKVDVDNASLQIIVVDDGSTDGTADAIVAVYPDVKILKGNGNLWWTGAVNKGVEFALGQDFDYALILNDDLELEGDFLIELLAVAKKSQNALVSSIKLNKRKDGNEQIIAAGFKVVGLLKEIERLHADELYQPDKIDDLIDCDILTGASLLVPLSVFKKVGIFDETNFPHHWGDFEFTRRASLSDFKCLVATKSKIYTEYNQNYAIPFLIRSTRKEFMKSLFNNTKYYHGVFSIIKSSYMHKNFIIGTLLFLRRFFGLLKIIFLKFILPANVLKRIFQQ